MKYKLRRNYTQEPENALQEILEDRGVRDYYNFIRPNKECELDPYLLDNIKEAAKLLLKHLRNDSKICFIIDCDLSNLHGFSL